MVLVTGNWRVWLAGMAASLVIFAIVYFAVIAPSMNTANQVLKTGLQQTQQAVNQAQKQISSAAKQSGVSGAVTGQAQQGLNKASKLAACVSAAGTDPTKLAACQTQ